MFDNQSPSSVIHTLLICQWIFHSFRRFTQRENSASSSPMAKLQLFTSHCNTQMTIQVPLYICAICYKFRQPICSYLLFYISNCCFAFICEVFDICERADNFRPLVRKRIGALRSAVRDNAMRVFEGMRDGVAAEGRRAKGELPIPSTDGLEGFNTPAREKVERHV
jgi:hypothetical protein